MSNEFIVKNGLIVGGNVVTSGTITINGALAATQSWVTSQAYLTSASLSGYATQSYVTSAISSLIDAAPAALDTLNELAAALGDDANFSTTITNSIASKLSLTGGTLTGALTGTSATFSGAVSVGNLRAGITNTIGWTGQGGFESITDGNFRLYNEGRNTYGNLTLGAATLSGTLTGTSATFNGDLTLSANSSYININRISTAADGLLVYKTGGSNRWLLGAWGNSNNTFYLYSYGVGGSVFSVDYSTGIATFSNNLITTNGIADPGYVRITNPEGGISVGNSPTSAAIKIALPANGSFTNIMLSFTVHIYDYALGKTRTLKIAGYTYYNQDWYNMSVYQSGGELIGNINVRFGVEGGRNCVWIGETNTYWSYPNIFVTDVQCGHSQTANLTSGWTISLVTTLGTVQNTIVAYTNITTKDIGGTTNYVSKFTGANTLGNSLIFDNGTNVGIGITSPTEKLHVNGDTRIVGNTYVGGIINAYQGDASIWVPNLGQAFTVKQTTGNVGIGTASPIYKLQVAGSAYVNGGTLFIDSGQYLRWGNSNQGIVGVNDSHVAIVSGGATRQTVYADGRTYFPGLDLSISNVNGSHGSGTYFRGDGGHFVFGLSDGNTLYLNYGNSSGILRTFGTWYHESTQILSTSRVLTNVSGNISMFTNDAGYLTSVSDVWVNTSGDTMTGALTIQGGWASTILDGDNVVLRKPNYSAGGWARTLLNFQEYDGTSLFQIGGYGSNNVMTYGYLGSAYNTPTIKWYANKNVYFSGNILIDDAADNNRYQKGATFLNLRDPWNNLHLSTDSIGGNYIDANVHYWRPAGGASYWMTLNGGNLGIGTTSPSAKLEISGFSTGAGLKLNYGNSSGTIEAVNFIANGGANGVIGMQMVSAGVGDLWLGGSGGRSLTLYRDGNVGIGTTSPSKLLEVAGDIMAGTSNKIGFRYSGGDSNFYNYITANNANPLTLVGGMWTANGTTEGIRFSTYNGAAVSILNNGKVGIGTTAPAEEFHVLGRAIFDGGSGDSSTDAVVYITKSNNNDWGLYVNASGLDYGMYTRVSPSAGYAIGVNNGTNWTTRITGDGRIYLSEKDTIASYDTWLRLNESGHYGSGVYTPGVMRADGGFYVSGSQVWHAGNDGSGSGLDADLLDGQNSTEFLRLLSGGAEASLDSYTDNGIRSVNFTGHSQHLLSWNAGGSTGTVQQLFHYGTSNNGWRIRNKTDNSSWSDWGYVVMASSNQGLISGTIATQSYVNTQISNLVNGAPGALDTLNELATALGNDASFATTVTNSIAGKVSKAGDTMTGNLTLAGGTNILFTGGSHAIAGNNTGYLHFYDYTNVYFNNQLVIRGGIQNDGGNVLIDDNLNVAGELAFPDGGGAYTNIIRAAAYPSEGYPAGVNFWMEYRAKGGHHFILNTDGGVGSGANAMDDFVVWQGAIDGNRLLEVSNIGNLWIAGALTEASSLKLKENVETSEGNLEKVVNLRPVTYNKIGSQTTELGLIAEEVAEVYPEFVQYDENGEPIGVHYSRLTAALIGAVKELNEQLQELKRNK